MRSLRKLGSGLTALALCFLLTGFFGGGEKPQDSGEKSQDCITAIIKALENNDSKAFKERVPLDFWFTFGLLFHDEYRKHMNEATSGKMDFMKDFAPGKETEANWRFKRIAQNYFEKSLDKVIDSGSTALDAQFSMWTPEELSKIKASEAGTGEEADTATAVFEVKGQKVTLGLAKINNKWVLLSASGNKKGALDVIALLKKHWQGVAIQEQEKAEAEKKQKERAAALNTCIEDILNIVQITPKQVIVEQEGKYLYVKIQAELLNTGTKLCNIDNVQMIFADKN